MRQQVRCIRWHISGNHAFRHTRPTQVPNEWRQGKTRSVDRKVRASQSHEIRVETLTTAP